MPRALSDDLRLRVVEEIEAGASRRSAASKFKVSIASAVRWHQRYRRSGCVCPDRMGGDRLSERAERHAKTVLGWIEEKQDISLVEICARLKEQGHSFAPSTIWRLLDRHKYTVKKRRVMQVNRNAKT